MRSIKELVFDYDSGKEVETVLMGGISNSYESSIQELAFSIMRKLQNIKPDKINVNDLNKIADVEVKRLNNQCGFSGAQVCAAKNLASVLWHGKHEPPKERIIKIKKGPDGFVETLGIIGFLA